MRDLSALDPFIEQHELARPELAHRLRADEIEGAALRRQHPVITERAEHERPEAVGVPEAEQLPLRQHDSGCRSVDRSSVCERRPRRAAPGQLAIRAAISSESELDARRTPSLQLSRSYSVFVRLPCGRVRRCASAVWWING